MRNRFLMAVGAAAALVCGSSLGSVSVAAQTAAPKAATPAKKAWTPRHLPDGQPDIQGVWLAQGMGTEPKVGGPFDANSSAAKISEKRKIAQETGGTASGIGGRCDSVYWDAKPDLTVAKGVIDPPSGEV